MRAHLLAPAKSESCAPDLFKHVKEPGAEGRGRIVVDGSIADGSGMFGMIFLSTSWTSLLLKPVLHPIVLGAERSKGMLEENLSSMAYLKTFSAWTKERMRKALLGYTWVHMGTLLDAAPNIYVHLWHFFIL